MQTIKEVLVRYNENDDYIPLKCTWTSKAEKDLEKFHGVSLLEETLEAIVKIAGDNYRSMYYGQSSVYLELTVTGESGEIGDFCGAFVSYVDGSYIRVDKNKTDWDFKPDADPVATSDFFYDIAEGGYIKPATLLNNTEQIDKVNDAINTLTSFRAALKNAGLLDMM